MPAPVRVCPSIGQLQSPDARFPWVNLGSGRPYFLWKTRLVRTCAGFDHTAEASAVDGSGEQMAMDEDVSGAAGLKSSSSAPDLHLLLEGALQGGPRSLLSPRQHFSGSTVGALVPYKGTEVRSAFAMRMHPVLLLEARAAVREPQLVCPAAVPAARQSRYRGA